MSTARCTVNGLEVYAVYTDINKAFDKVNQSILLKNWNGISGCLLK